MHFHWIGRKQHQLCVRFFSSWCSIFLGSIYNVLSQTLYTYHLVVTSVNCRLSFLCLLPELFVWWLVWSWTVRMKKMSKSQLRSETWARDFHCSLVSESLSLTASRCCRSCCRRLQSLAGWNLIHQRGRNNGEGKAKQGGNIGRRTSCFWKESFNG